MAPKQLGQLRAHYQAVVEANRVTNLTRIVEPAAAAVKHYADSLALCLWVNERGIEADTVLDIGTGAGFPAVPLAAARPDWTVTAIDATRKKVDFLSRAAQTIGLSNLNVLHAHSQHWQPGLSFQIVVLRAVAQLPKALEQSARHVAPRGWLVAYQAAPTGRGDNPDDKPMALPAGLHLDTIYPYSLRAGDETLGRGLHVFRKIRPDRSPGNNRDHADRRRA